MFLKGKKRYVRYELMKGGFLTFPIPVLICKVCINKHSLYWYRGGRA